MALNQNQFAIQQAKGLLDLRFNDNIHSAVIDASEAGTLLPGQAVKLVDSAGGVPKVIATTADTDAVFGFIVYNNKNQKFVAGNAVEIASADSVMYMEASAAFARGASIMVVVTGQKVALATTGKTIVGYAYDKAVNVGDIVRVYVTCTPIKQVA